MTEDDVVCALRDCFEPTYKVNVVDLGLVESVLVEVDLEAPGAGIVGVPVKHRVRVEMLAVSEESGVMVGELVRNRLLGMEAVGLVDVVVLGLAWSAERMTEAGRALVGERRGLVNIGVGLFPGKN